MDIIIITKWIRRIITIITKLIGWTNIIIAKWIRSIIMTK